LANLTRPARFGPIFIADAQQWGAAARYAFDSGTVVVELQPNAGRRDSILVVLSCQYPALGIAFRIAQHHLLAARDRSACAEYQLDFATCRARRTILWRDTEPAQPAVYLEHGLGGELVDVGHTVEMTALDGISTVRMPYLTLVDSVVTKQAALPLSRWRSLTHVAAQGTRFDIMVPELATAPAKASGLADLAHALVFARLIVAPTIAYGQPVRVSESAQQPSLACQPPVTCRRGAPCVCKARLDRIAARMAQAGGAVMHPVTTGEKDMAWLVRVLMGPIATLPSLSPSSSPSQAGGCPI
jgi:hypothetical protein